MNSSKKKAKQRAVAQAKKKKLMIIIGSVAVVAVVVTVALIMILGGNKVKTKVPAKYVDGFADKYAESKTVDSKGNVKYTFKDDKYEEFLTAYHEVVKEETRNINSTRQNIHYNLNVPEIKVGLEDGVYEETGEAALKAEARELGKAAIKYQMNTKNPIKTISVTYRNANTGKVYFVEQVSAD